MTAMAQQLTVEEKMTLKNAVYGAVYLVSNVDPGFFATFRESFAASKRLAGSVGVVRDALTSDGIPGLPRSSARELETIVLPALSDSVRILRAKAPEEVEAFRAIVLAACGEVAAAAGGTGDAENAEIGRIRGALEV
jgi:hypothetical protein